MADEIVLHEDSPHGNLDAIVEQDGRVAYFYVRAPANDEFGLRACWVGNLAAAPETLDVGGMQDGTPPMLPRRFCAHPEGRPALDPERLELVWFPEGDAAALLEDGRMLAAIPAWAGIDGFEGYARDCIGQSPLCWGLEDTVEFDARIATAQRFWKAWTGDGSPWETCRDALVDAYERDLGPHTRYFAIDGGEWPPKALIRIDRDDAVHLATLGVSLRPQPRVEMHYDDPTDHRRFELAGHFSSEIAEETVMRFAGYLSGQSGLPWSGFTFLGPGHTIPCDSFEDDPQLSGFTAILLAENPRGGPAVDVPRVDGDRVNLLWAVPITAAERRLAMSQGSQTVLDLFPADRPVSLIAPRAEL